MHIAFKRFTPHVILEVHPGYDNINYTEGEIFEVRLPDDVNIATADHKIPYALGGDSNRENLIICCFPCNAQKGMYATYETFIAKKQGVDSE